MIKWTKIERDTVLPDEEVIALKEETEEVAVGFLNVHDKTLVCDEEYSILEFPTHYILKKDLIKLVV